MNKSSSFTSQVFSVCLFLFSEVRMKGWKGKKEGEEKKKHPASISPDSFTHPASFTELKEGSTMPAKCIVDENHKGGI